jgi:hypothetical protein
MKVAIIIVIIIIIILYIYNVQFRVIPVNEQEFDKLEFKTGDIILMKANNNYHSLIHGSYFGHVGMIYVDYENKFINDIDPSDSKNRNVFLFEANATKVYPYNGIKGIYISPLRNRLEHYSGNLYLKPLNKPLDLPRIEAFKEFIAFSLQNMYYNHSIITNALLKVFGLKRCRFDTDCGQILFLALIKMKLIPFDEYYVARLNHLELIIKIKELIPEYYYTELTKIIPMKEEYSFKTGNFYCICN